MKKALTNNIGLKILSLLFAVVFWLVVVNIDDPTVSTTISGIPVTIMDEDIISSQEQVYSVVSGETATITVKGPRSQVDKLGRDDFVAEAPFSEKSNVDAVPIYVKFRNSKYEKTVEITQKTMTMKLDVENIVSKSYDIAINHTSDELAGYKLGKEVIEPATVTVKAPESIINLISKVQVDVDLSGHTEDFSEELPIKYYTETGSLIDLGANATTNYKTSKVTSKVYTIKEVPLKFGSVGNVKEGYELVEVIGDKQTLKIAGPNAERIESIVFPDELINIADASEDVTVDIDVGAQLPSGVMLVDEENDSHISVTAKIEKLIVSDYRLPISEIDINNIPDGYKAEFTQQSISISLIGLQKDQDSFSIDNIKAYVDLRNAIEGENEVIVKMTLLDGLKIDSEVRAVVNLINSSQQSATQSTTESQTTANQTTSKSEETSKEETTVPPNKETVKHGE